MGTQRPTAPPIDPPRPTLPHSAPPGHTTPPFTPPPPQITKLPNPPPGGALGKRPPRPFVQTALPDVRSKRSSAKTPLPEQARCSWGRQVPFVFWGALPALARPAVFSVSGAYPAALRSSLRSSFYSFSHRRPVSSLWHPPPFQRHDIPRREPDGLRKGQLLLKKQPLS